MTRPNIIVIGGGIAGLSVAWHLVAHNHHVTVVESETVGSGASTKAAGMITPASEVHLGENILMECFLRCADYYNHFSQRITGGNPSAIDYHRNGSLLCAIDHNGQQELSRLANFQKDMGLGTEEISLAQLRLLEPQLTHKTSLAYFAKNEAHVDTTKLIDCLKINLIESGLCDILEHKAVQSFNFNGSQLTSVTLDHAEPTTLIADQVVLTTGLGLLQKNIHPDLELPLRAVKGQVLTFKLPEHTLSRPVRVYHRYPIYLVPRDDGRVVVGATSEEFSDTDITAGGALDLIYSAWQVLPQIYDAPIVSHVAGLRPATIDHKPIWGRTNIDNVFVLNGLYRHGIMASPYLARELVKLMMDQSTDMNLEEFSITRFARRSQ